jgi:hypothetical protein
MLRMSARVEQQRAALHPAPAPAPTLPPPNVLFAPQIIPVPADIVDFRGRAIRRGPVEVRISFDNYTTIHALENIPMNSPARLQAVYAGHTRFLSEIYTRFQRNLHS